MNDFSRCNKVTGVYWLKKSLDDLKIKITIKPQDGTLSLPKFEEYTNKSKLTLESAPEEYIFKWQQKVFSAWEIQRYTDVHSCINDVELKYHDVIEDVESASKIFTYVHEDGHGTLDFKKKKPCLVNLEQRLDRLRLNEGIGRVFGGNTVSTQRLFTSSDDISDDGEEWTAMHIVFDNSDYNEDSQLLFKQEVILLSLYHNIVHNYLIMMPDVNNLELNPYSVETAAGVPWGYQYAVDVEFGEMGGGDELMVLLRKLLKKWERKQKCLVNFTLPPLGRKKYYITLELLTASGFDMDNLYIEFDIKTYGFARMLLTLEEGYGRATYSSVLPPYEVIHYCLKIIKKSNLRQIHEGVQCNDTLHGRTHTTEASHADEKWNFGHVVDIYLDIDAGLEPPPLKLFFEVISTDWWGRHRTEGYTYFPLTLDPGRHTKHLSCSRPEELDIVEAENRRFFVGGCHLIKNLDVLAEPQLQDANFRFQTTGTICLRWNIVSQTSSRGVSAPPPQPGTSSASALLLGAETALRKYRKARARLAAATKDLGDAKFGSGEE